MAHAIALNTHTGAFHAPRPDPTRIIGQAAAIAINGVLLLALLTPMSVPPLPPEVEVEEVTQVHRIPRKPIEGLLPPQNHPLPPRPVPLTDPPRKTATLPVDPVLADSQPGDEVAPPLTPAEDVPVSIEPPASNGAHLQTINAPPPSYPPQAAREGLTGVVELEILVGIDGKPLEARVTRSSGHRVLDQAARRIVLSRWTFQPAMRDGQPVQALGRVPIEFKLDR